MDAAVPGAMSPAGADAMAEHGDPDPVRGVQHGTDQATDRDTLVEIARLIVTKEPLANGGRTTPPEADPDLEHVDLTALAERAVVARLLDAVPAGVALCREDALLCANTNFALAFGYRSPEELRDQGGLGAVLPQIAESLKGAGDVTRDEPITANARTRSGRSLTIPMSVLDVASERRLALLVLHPKAPPQPRAQQTAADPLLALGDALADGLALLDRDGRTKSVSAGARAAFGESAGLTAGAAFDALLARGDRLAFAAALARLRSASADTATERLTAGLEAGGEADLVLGRTTVHGEPALWVAIRRQDQESKAAEAASVTKAAAAPGPVALPAPTRTRADFLAKVSHEVRTPLNSIIGFAELMKGERFGPLTNAKYREYAQDIYDSGIYALSLINDLLDISKVEAGKFELNFTAVEINEVIAEAVHLMQPQAKAERVVLRAALAEIVPPVLADRRSLKQILLNLLSNAVKFTPAGGQAIVSSSLEPNGEARIRVRDTGVGMTQAEIAQALEPFRQLDTAPRQQAGSGLGLPLTKALVTANRARFEIESEARGGTRVDMIFPKDRVVG